MATSYQYDSNGYYAGEIESYGLLPNNATEVAPTLKTGYVPHWTGTEWEQIENHKEESGYVDGKQKTITDYGPYPDGWSTTPPEKTNAELLASLRAARDVKLTTIYDPAIAQLNRSRRLASTDEARTAIDAKIALWDAWAVALCNLPAQDGSPWDGGGSATPWPDAPSAE